MIFFLYGAAIFMKCEIVSLKPSIWRIDPFSTNVPLLYPLENIRKPKDFRGYRTGTLVKNGLTVNPRNPFPATDVFLYPLEKKETSDTKWL